MQPAIVTPQNKADRQCGDCTLCCKLVPVRSIEKPRDTWCQHCDSKRGCKIYDDRPNDCRVWSCLWLIDGNAHEKVFPRKKHCVFDVMTDLVSMGGQDRQVFQLWVDPAYPLAYRDPDIRREIDRLGRMYGLPTIVRLRYRGILVVPPSLTRAGFLEKEAQLAPEQEWGDDAWQSRFMKMAAEDGI